jgi:hypothetical protein
MTAIDNAGLKVGDTVKEIVTGKPTPAHMKVKFRPKTNQQINRETVSQVRGIPSAVKNAAKKAYYTPGQVIDEGVKFAAENPIAAVGGVGSKGLMFAVPETAALPIGNGALLVDVGLKKNFPRYQRWTQRMGNAWEGTRTSQALKTGDSAPVMASRLSQMIPL